MGLVQLTVASSALPFAVYCTCCCLPARLVLCELLHTCLVCCVLPHARPAASSSSQLSGRALGSSFLGMCVFGCLLFCVSLLWLVLSPKTRNSPDQTPPHRTTNSRVLLLPVWLMLMPCAGPALAPVLADPAVVKVLHGADSDIVWLQRDYGLFVVNLFDTGQVRAGCGARP